MYVTGYLCKNGKCLLSGMYEDLIDFVEELKKINPEFVNRKELKIISTSGDILYQWFRK